MSSAPSPRSNWLVSLILGVLRGIISLLQWLVTRLERNPSNPWGGVAVLGGAIALVFSVTFVFHRLPLPIWLAEVLRPDLPAVTVAQAPDSLNSRSRDLEPNATRSNRDGSEGQGSPFDAFNEADDRNSGTLNNAPIVLPPDALTPAGLDENGDRLTEPSSAPSSAQTAESPATDSSLAPTEAPTNALTDASIDALTDVNTDINTNVNTNINTGEALEKIPAELTAPAEPIVVADAPPPLTPEQRLLAALQERIADVEVAYADRSIVAEVQVNFDANHLDVVVKERWYDLSEREQDELAEEFRDRGENFDFYDLAILDTQGNLVARPALVGSGVVILRRSLS